MARLQRNDFITPLLSEFNTKLRDIEEKQRLLKERVLLIGQNLVESKDSTERELTTLKLDVEELKENVENYFKHLKGIIEE